MLGRRAVHHDPLFVLHRPGVAAHRERDGGAVELRDGDFHRDAGAQGRIEEDQTDVTAGEGATLRAVPKLLSAREQCFEPVRREPARRQEVVHSTALQAARKRAISSVFKTRGGRSRRT